MVLSLVSIYFDSPQLSPQNSYNKNKLYKTLEYWSRDKLNFNFSKNGLGLVSPPILWEFYKENVSHATFYWLTKFYCLMAFISREIGKYTY